MDCCLFGLVCTFCAAADVASDDLLLLLELILLYEVEFVSTLFGDGAAASGTAAVNCAEKRCAAEAACVQLSSSSMHIILVLQLLPPPTTPIINEGTPKINNCATINIHKTTSISNEIVPELRIKMHSRSLL